MSLQILILLLDMISSQIVKVYVLVIVWQCSEKIIIN